MIDSHTHLDSCAPPDAELVAAAREAGVTRLLTIGTREASNAAALEAADAFPDVFAAVGRHPNHADGYDDAAEAALHELARDPRCLAVGETGLDFFRDGAPRDVQLRAFESQIAIARDVGKPLIIHTRAADDDTISTLRSRADGVTVVLHCFSMPDRLEEAASEGWWTSFAGNCTYPKNRDLAFAAETAPDERLLVETDAPYLTPQVVRKQRNQPAFVTHTARFVAARRGVAYDELDALVTANAERLFGW